MKFLIYVCLTLGILSLSLSFFPYKETYVKVEPKAQVQVIKKNVKKTHYKAKKYVLPTGSVLSLAEKVSKETGYSVEIVSKIMWAESQYVFRDSPKNRNGTVDHGYFQINDIHIPEAKKHGLDIVNSPHDNATFAIILMKRNGLRDWGFSKEVWSKI